MKIMDRQEFFEVMEAFRLRHKMTPTVFSREICGDPAFHLKVKNGRSPSLDKAAAVLRAMEAFEEGVAA